MDIDAALKDGYSIEEINAEAAKRAGFNLTGAKADGYSDDEILQELRGRLSKTTKPTSDFSNKIEEQYAALRQGGENWNKGLQGAAETGLHLLTGVGAMVGGIPVGAIQTAREALAGNTPDFGKEYANAMQRMTYEPSTETGKEMAGNAGEIINRYLLPLAPMAHIPSIGINEAVSAARSRMPTRLPQNVLNEIPKPVSKITGALDELKSSEVPPDPNAAYYKAQAEAKQQAAIDAQTAQGQRPITVGPSGVEMPGMQSSLEAMSSFDRQVRRAEREPAPASETPLQVDRQGQVFYPERAEDVASTELARKQGAETTTGLRNEQTNQSFREAEQADLFEPQTNMYRAYTDVRAAEGTGERPLSLSEFKTTVDNLAKEEGTRFQKPEDMLVAYKQYLDSLNEKQGGLFDIGSRQEAFQKSSEADKVPAQAMFDPAVIKLSDKVSKQEQLVVKIQMQLEAGKPVATHLTRALNELKSLEKLEADTKKNVEQNMLNQIFGGKNGTTELRSGFTKEDVTEAWRKVGLAFEDVKRTMSSVDIHKQDVYTEVAKDIQMYLDTGMPVVLHYAGQELKAAGYPESVTNAFKEMTKAATEYDRIKKTAEMPFELRKTYNLQRQVSDTARRLSAEAVAVYNQVGEKRYKELTRAEKKLVKEASEKDMDAYRIGSKTGLTPSEVFDRDWSMVNLGDIQRSAEFFDTAAKQAAKEFLAKWNTPSKTPYGNKVVNLHANFDPDSFKMAGLRAQFGKSPLLNVPGIGDRLKSIGNAMIESPQAAIDLAKQAPDVSQNSVQKTINLLTKGGLYLKAKVNNPLVHFTVDKFIEADRLAKSEVFEKLQGQYLTALRSLSKEEYQHSFELLNAADLNKKQLTPEFLAKHGFSDNVQTFIKTHQEMMKDVLDKINIAREATGKKPVAARDAYSAMNMSGDFRKVVYKTVDGEKQVVGVIGANTKNVGKNSLSSLEKKVLEKDPTLEFGPMQDVSVSTRSLKGSPHEAFMDVLKILGDDNPNIKEFLNTLAEVAKDDPANYMGMQKHTMQKKGVWGMEGRKPWMSEKENATAFFENQVKYIESAYTWSHLAEAAREVNTALRDKDVVGKQDNAIKMSEAYMQNALGLNPNKFGVLVDKAFDTLFSSVGIGSSIPRTGLQLMKATANTALLSLNHTFLALQLMQVPSVLPGLTALLRGRGAAGAHTWLTQGFDSAAKASMSMAKAVISPEKLSPFEKDAFSYIKKYHVAASDTIEHATQTQKGLGYYTTKITQTPAALLETGTRTQMFLTIAHMLKDNGYTKETNLFQQADRFTDFAMTNYSAMEKPAIYNAMGPIGSLAYNLKSFGHNEMSRWSMYAREIGNTGNPAPLLTQMATTIALAGIMGLPLFSQWESIYDYITKKLGKPRSLALDVMQLSGQAKSVLGDNGTYALSHGAPSMLGVDVSKRLGLGDVMPSNAADVAFPGGGKIGQMVGSGIDLAARPSEQTAKAFAYNMAPPSAQGPLDVSWYQKGNLAYSKDPNKLRVVAERTPLDTSLKQWGLTGINESVQKERNYRLDQLTKAYAEYRTAAMNDMAQDIFRNKPINAGAIDKYFRIGQGDPQTFERELQQTAISLNMSPQQAAMLREAASQRIPQLRALQRRMQ